MSNRIKQSQLIKALKDCMEVIEVYIDMTATNCAAYGRAQMLIEKCEHDNDDFNPMTDVEKAEDYYLNNDLD